MIAATELTNKWVANKKCYATRKRKRGREGSSAWAKNWKARNEEKLKKERWESQKRWETKERGM